MGSIFHMQQAIKKKKKVVRMEQHTPLLALFPGSLGNKATQGTQGASVDLNRLHL